MKDAALERAGGGSRHGIRVVLIVLVGVLAAGAGLAISRGPEAPGPPRPTAVAEGAVDTVDPMPTTTYTEPFVVPEGKVPVAFDDGGRPGIAGFVDEASQDMDVPAPVLDLGSGRIPVRGWEVTDADGVLVGYFVGSFVDLATARNVEAMDAFLADQASRVQTWGGTGPDEALPPGVPDPRGG
jgi:hypothetical protein